MMLVSLYLVFLGFSFHQDPDPLSKYLWKQRVIIIYSPTLDAQHQKQLAELTQAEPGITDRDLVILSLFSTSGYGPKKEPLEVQDQRFLKQAYIAPKDEFRFLLIGKDGGVKLDRTEMITPTELFAVIDKMPMRINEMKRKQ